MTGLLDAARHAPADLVRTIADFSGRGAPPLPRHVVQRPHGRTIAYAVTGGHGPDVPLIHGMLMTLEDMWLGPRSRSDVIRTKQAL